MLHAQNIYQAHLDAVSERLWREDFAGVAAMMRYPSPVTTNDATTMIESPKHMIKTLKVFRASLVRLGATDYHRTCVEAHFVDDRDDIVEGQHLTYALRNGTYAIEPMASYMSLQRVGEAWLGAGIRTMVHNRDCTVFQLTEHAVNAQR